MTNDALSSNKRTFAGVELALARRTMIDNQMRSISVLDEFHFLYRILHRTVHAIKVKTIITFYALVDQIGIFRMLLKVDLEHKLRYEIFFLVAAINAFCEILIAMRFGVYFGVDPEHLLCYFHLLLLSFFLNVSQSKLCHDIDVDSAVLVALCELRDKFFCCRSRLALVEFHMSDVSH